MSTTINAIKANNNLNQCLKNIITTQQAYIAERGYRVKLHFEFEGCYIGEKPIDFQQVNQQFRQFGIAGELVAEYWKNQWEYVSLFHGQSPLQEAEFLQTAICLIPQLFAKQGVHNTLIQPVVWSGDQGKLAHGCQQIFSGEQRAVHIPNAVQINISVEDQQQQNLIATTSLGELLQQQMMQTSYNCAVLFLPEADAYERLQLKSKYGLERELCSPNDISGGHQGSIALYRQKGKHNQPLGVQPLVIDKQQKMLSFQQNWQKTARIEHRLGASSLLYNPFFNVVYSLACVIEALAIYSKPGWENQLAIDNSPKHLPLALENSADQLGAVELFKQETWLENHIDSIQKRGNLMPEKLGAKVKHQYLQSISNNQISIAQ